MHCRGDTRPARGSKLTLLSKRLNARFARTVDGYNPSSHATLNVLASDDGHGIRHSVMFCVALRPKYAMRPFTCNQARCLRLLRRACITLWLALRAPWCALRARLLWWPRAARAKGPGLVRATSRAARQCVPRGSLSQAVLKHAALVG